MAQASGLAYLKQNGFRCLILLALFLAKLGKCSQIKGVKVFLFCKADTSCAELLHVLQSGRLFCASFILPLALTFSLGLKLCASTHHLFGENKLLFW